jgi:hypothetical protein
MDGHLAGAAEKEIIALKLGRKSGQCASNASGGRSLPAKTLSERRQLESL